MDCDGVFQTIEVLCLSKRGVTLQRKAMGGWKSITLLIIIGFTKYSQDDLTSGMWSTI